MTKYYYIASNQMRFLQEEVLEEILRERANYYIAKKRPLDFWLLISPKFLYEPEMKEKIKKTKYYLRDLPSISWKARYNFYAVVISTNKEFIKWLKLRVGYFEDIDEPETGNFQIDGFYGFIDSEKSKVSPLEGQNNLIHPRIRLIEFETALDMYYELNFPRSYK